MDYYSENALKVICCTCLSRERKLFQLCRLVEGVNNLYSLLSYDAEAYKEGFYKDTASLHVCWECKAMLSRISLFRHQACSVQKQLTDIADGRTNIGHIETSLSKLKTTTKDGYDVTISDKDETTDNFIDCGPSSVNTDDGDDDVPLSDLHHKIGSDEEQITSKSEKPPSTVKVRIKKKKVTKAKGNKSFFKFTRYFKTTEMSYEEMLKSREAMRTGAFEDALYKCESCVKVFKTDIVMQKHKEDYHSEKENHSQCTVCLSFAPDDDLESHMSSHLTQHACKICGVTVRSVDEATDHMRNHRNAKGSIKMTRRNPVSKSNKNAITDDVTSGEFKCPECNKHFESKNKRWKHVQKQHREWYACDQCGKRFAFRNNLHRHLRLHESPPPREQCEVCHKLIRCDLLKIHARIHLSREACECRACDKTFVSRASYHHHLKYTRAHALQDILKYKCPSCDKGYRSRGELRDHLNYQHHNQTRHRCVECGKALATRRCVTRHVRRAHRGLKENARDKICQQCGKAFRDKKGLREHEFIHTGERPLACELCGCTFRQSASLYTHKKRVHKIYPKKKSVQLVDNGSGAIPD